MEKKPNPVVLADNPPTTRGGGAHRTSGSSRSIRASSTSSTSPGLLLSLKGLLLDNINDTSSVAGGGGAGASGVTRKRKKRFKVMAILWMTGLLCFGGLSFFLPLVLIEFIYHDEHNHIDTTTTTTTSNMNRDKSSRPDDTTNSSSSSVSNANRQRVGVHQLVHATKKLHNERRQRQQQQQQQPDGEKKQQQQQRQVPVVVPGDLLARGVAGRPMKDTPALIGAQRAHVECNVPVDDAMVAYWNDPVGTRDAHFNTVFNSQKEEEEETTRSQQTEQTTTQYITFSPDQGGWNNIRMSMEIVFVLAAITGRTLVLPASCNMYLLNKKKPPGGNGPLVPRSFGDFFPLDKIRRWGVPIISMQEFLLAQEGKLLPTPLSSSFRIDNNKTVIVNRKTLLESALHCENRKRADYSCFAIYELLNRAGYNPNVTDTMCVVFDEQTYGYSSISKNNTSNINTKNEPSARAKEMATQICGKRPIVYWSRDISAHHQLLYLPAIENDFRLLTHFYGLLHFSNATVDNYMKRFVRDNLHYHDEIYCAAGKIVQALQKEGALRRRNNNETGNAIDNSFGESYYSALHIRRGDLQYKEVKIPSSEWYNNTKELWKPNEILYVATDERNKTWFEDLKQHHDLRFLDDYWEMAGLDQLDPDYMGMVDTIVASRGRLFCGTWFSTFSGYINRLRGYHGMSMKDSWYSFLPRKTALHEWTIVDKSVYAYEWPDGWIGIDADSFPQRDVF